MPCKGKLMIMLESLLTLPGNIFVEKLLPRDEETSNCMNILNRYEFTDTADEE